MRESFQRYSVQERQNDMEATDSGRQHLYKLYCNYLDGLLYQCTRAFSSTTNNMFRRFIE